MEYYQNLTASIHQQFKPSIRSHIRINVRSMREHFSWHSRRAIQELEVVDGCHNIFQSLDSGLFSISSASHITRRLNLTCHRLSFPSSLHAHRRLVVHFLKFLIVQCTGTVCRVRSLQWSFDKSKSNAINTAACRFTA